MGYQDAEMWFVNERRKMEVGWERDDVDQKKD
jgi:hypothetical protein